MTEATPVGPILPALPVTEAHAASSVDSPSTHQAWREAELLSTGKSADELEREAAEAEHGRSQRFKNQFEYIAIGALWLSSLAVAAVAAIWLWHMMAPRDLRWLNQTDISHLQSIATAGLLVGVIGNHFKKRMS